MGENPSPETLNTLTQALQAVRAVRNSATQYFKSLAETTKDTDEEPDARQQTAELRISIK